MTKNVLSPSSLARLAFLVLAVCISLSGCAVTSDPENSGGEILASTTNCDFRISGNAKWLQYIGEQSPYHQSEERYSEQQRTSFLIDLETGENYPVEPDAAVRSRIAEGLGPDGLGCFSPDQTRLYFRFTDMSEFNRSEQETQETEDIQDDAPRDGASAGFSVPGGRVTRYHYVVDLTEKPFIIRETDHISCSESPDAVKPDISVRRESDRRIEIYSHDGRKLARHRPRGWLSRRIGIWELHGHRISSNWKRDYSLSPDENFLAYRISETGLIGFAAPTAGYMLDLSQRYRQDPLFLAASVYAMDWDSNGLFYACTSHSKHRNVIVRWDPGYTFAKTSAGL